MIFTSGSSPAVCCSKLAREMPRRAASGHIPSMQFLKSATAAQDRIRLHQRMAGRARLAAPGLALRRDGTGRGEGMPTESGRPAPSAVPATRHQRNNARTMFLTTVMQPAVLLPLFAASASETGSHFAQLT